ncbi:MAG: ATP-binding protein [Candidatus Muiribacteriaceae bacterium]
MNKHFDIEGGNFSAAGIASSTIKKLLKKLGLPVPVIRKASIAVYEAEINVVAHAYRGTIDVDIKPERLEVVVKDEGPGIPDINRAMEEGFSTASPKVREMGFGAGMGLPNIKKNTSSLDISSEINVGTELKFSIDFQ